MFKETHTVRDTVVYETMTGEGNIPMLRVKV